MESESTMRLIYTQIDTLASAYIYRLPPSGAALAVYAHVIPCTEHRKTVRRQPEASPTWKTLPAYHPSHKRRDAQSAKNRTTFELKGA